MRGVLGSTLILSLNIGILLGFTFGAYFSYYMTPIFAIILAIFSAIALYFFPESPPFLLKQNRMSVRIEKEHDENSQIFFLNNEIYSVGSSEGCTILSEYN